MYIKQLLTITIPFFLSVFLQLNANETDNFEKYVKSENIHKLKLLLKDNKNLVKHQLNLPTKYHRKAKVPVICWAASLGKTEVIPLLVKHGASLQEKGENPLTLIPLTIIGFAAQNGHLETVKDLIRQGAKSESKYSDEFYEAAINGQVKVARFLLTEIKNINQKPDLRDAFFDSVNAAQVEIVKLIAETGIDVNVKNEIGLYTIHFAAWRGHLELVKLLAKNGAKLNLEIESKAESFKGKNILHFAAESGNHELVAYLIKQKVNYRPSLHEVTPLHIAASSGYAKIIDQLIAYGAKANELKEGRSPLYMAASYGHVKACELLIKHGANVNYKNEQGDTALSRAAISRPKKDDDKSKKAYLECAKLLLKHGAKISPRDIKFASSEEMKKLLEQHK